MVPAEGVDAVDWIAVYLLCFLNQSDFLDFFFLCLLNSDGRALYWPGKSVICLSCEMIFLCY